MAEVLAPIQPSTSMTMLHPSPDAFQSAAPSSSHQHSRSAQLPRASMYSQQGGGMLGYRNTAATPVAPYAFQSTPNLRYDHRSPVGPSEHSQPTTQATSSVGNVAHASSSSASTVSSSSSSNPSFRHHAGSKDDTAIPNSRRLPDVNMRPLSSVVLPLPSELSLAVDQPTRPSPDRYRRNRRVEPTAPAKPQQIGGSAVPSGSGMGTVSHLYDPVGSFTAQPRPAHQRTSSADDTQVPRQTPNEQAKRYRRRSLGGFEPSSQPAASPAPGSVSDHASPVFAPPKLEEKVVRPVSSYDRPASRHQRTGSGESVQSSVRSHSRPSSARRDSNGSHGGPESSTMSTSKLESKSVAVPPRGSSDAARRLNNPSPLSRPVNVAEKEQESSRVVQATSSARESPQPSPAAQQLAALSGKDVNKGMKSRLRRALSFGSSAELRRASAANNASAERSKQTKREGLEVDEEQAAIVAKQEAAGIGAGIYSGQGGVFAGSTDNVSVSSTASSASIMLRKMGNGVRRSTRSLKGLFRPKSVIGAPSAEETVPQPSAAQVTMVTVEAERERVNVNASVQEQAAGATNYPRLERNSLDVAGSDVSRPVGAADPAADSTPRKSIIGGDRERAEVLAAVKKGILKRSGTSSASSSPVVRPADAPSEAALTGVPPITGGSRSSSPSTVSEDHQQRPVLVEHAGEDYFVTAPRLPSGSTRSLPNTPSGSARNISFSPRIQFHDAWSSTEYDRRGDIATCNRLTPLLAQQIKEELNSFKMEMEVHELSKPHTHFF